MRLSGEYSRVLELNAEATAILETLELGGSLEHADLVFTRATLFKETRDMEAAAPLYAQALAIREEHPGADNPALAATLRDYAYALRSPKRNDEAVVLESRAAALEQASVPSADVP